MRLGPSGSQALGHVGTAGSCQRTENGGPKARRLNLAQGWGAGEGEEELQLVPGGESGSTERPSKGG